MSNTKTAELLKLVQENPDLPIEFMVDSDVVRDDGNYWLGEFGSCGVTEIYRGRDYWHFKDDDEEDVLSDLAGCKYDRDFEGRDIYNLSEEEWKKLFESLPWEKCIAVYIVP